MSVSKSKSKRKKPDDLPHQYVESGENDVNDLLASVQRRRNAMIEHGYWESGMTEHSSKERALAVYDSVWEPYMSDQPRESAKTQMNQLTMYLETVVASIMPARTLIG